MKNTKVISIVNRKGGAGKSTCAAHIALEAAKANLKTILIDLDPQKTLEHWWNKREDANPYMADVTASDVEQKLAFINDNNFDLCIIDTPGDTSPNSIAGIRHADLILIPSKPTAPDLTAIGRTIAMIKEHGKPFCFVLTQTIPRTHAALQASSILSEFGPVAPTSLGSRISYANAMNVGESAGQFDKNAADELSGLWEFVHKKLFNISGNKNAKEKI
jgi:chromosome partitioning protein